MNKDIKYFRLNQTNPSIISKDVSVELKKCRNILLGENFDKAYYFLYSIANPMYFNMKLKVK